ncbi:MAG: DUF4837 family protein [Cyclobacteriaceae bacterium]|nr:DUF4837 family protein [Cyclobacteriaceae bacterium]
MRFFFFVIGVFLLASCSQSEKNRNVPNATGLPGDVFLVMDSLQWRGPLGRTIDSIFNEEMPGLPRKESIFKLRWINPRKLNFVLKQSRNIVFAVSLDQNTEGAQIVKKIFTLESIEKIKTSTTEFVNTDDDVFAKGQQVMYLYGNTSENLIRNIKANGSKLTDFFDIKERERMTKSLFKAGQVKGVSEFLIKDMKCDLKIPFGYKLVEKKSDFIWLRQINPKDDKNLFIARKAYSSQSDFSKENLIKFRDAICRQYLFEDPAQPDTYLLTETDIPFIPVVADTITFNKHFAVKLSGIWRSNTMAMGGPFTGIAVVDEGTQQFYYVEGFTFSPGKDQREIIRELETIVYTFRTSTELPKQ